MIKLINQPTNSLVSCNFSIPLLDLVRCLGDDTMAIQSCGDIPCEAAEGDAGGGDAIGF